MDQLQHGQYLPVSCAFLKGSTACVSLSPSLFLQAFFFLLPFKWVCFSLSPSLFLQDGFSFVFRAPGTRKRPLGAALEPQAWHGGPNAQTAASSRDSEKNSCPVAQWVASFCQLFLGRVASLFQLLFLEVLLPCFNFSFGKGCFLVSTSLLGRVASLF